MQISQPRVTTRTRVSVDIAGAEPLYSPETDGPVDPVTVTVHYSYRVSVSADGWAHHTWAHTMVRVSGEGGDVAWVWYFNQDSTTRPDKPMPAWLADLVDRLRPSGEVALTRVKGF